MAPDPVKCTLNTFGTFSTPTFAGVGEPYNDKTGLDHRASGRQFVVNKQRAGQTGDNWNRGTYGRRIGYQRLYEGETYVDPHTHRRRAALEEKKKNLTPDGFRYPNPNKKSSGLGNYWGCIGPKFKHEADFEVLKKGENPEEIQHPLRQVLTNPAKKGYGGSTPGTIFGPGPRKGEQPKIGKEYEHAPDPYDMPRQAEKAERALAREKLAGRPPFKSGGHSLDFFDGHKSVAASKVYTEDPRIPEKPPEEKAPLAITAPFYPSKAPRSGIMGTFNKFPVYLEDPLDAKIAAAKAAADAAKLTSAPFRPTSKPKSGPVKSVLFHHPGASLA